MKTRKTKARDPGPVILCGPWHRERELLRELAKASNVAAVWTWRRGEFVRVPVDRLGA